MPGTRSLRLPGTQCTAAFKFDVLQTVTPSSRRGRARYRSSTSSSSTPGTQGRVRLTSGNCSKASG
eukprot:459097-Rhodomonas_salina.1